MKSAAYAVGILGCMALLGGGASASLSGCAVTSTNPDFGDSGTADVDSGTGSHVDGGKKDSGGGGNPDTGTNTGTADCNGYCAKGSGANCNPTACVTACQNTSQIPAACLSAYDDYINCGATTGTATTCNTKGAPQISGCDTQLQALVACLQPATDGGGPPPGDAGAGCGLTLNKPACDQCLNTSCCSQEMACANDTKCIPLNQCLAACAAGDTACANACYAGPNGSAKGELDAFYSCLQANCTTQCQ